MVGKKMNNPQNIFIEEDIYDWYRPKVIPQKENKKENEN
jgi:hypothetical protein